MDFYKKLTRVLGIFIGVKFGVKKDYNKIAHKKFYKYSSLEVNIFSAELYQFNFHKQIEAIIKVKK